MDINNVKIPDWGKQLFSFIFQKPVLLWAFLCGFLLYATPIFAQKLSVDSKPSPPLQQMTEVNQIDNVPSDIHFDHFAEDEALASLWIRGGIVQDQHGFLWVGTNEGLIRYDGYELILYRHDEENPNSLIENSLRGMTFDEGNLWLATSAGISKFNIETETFTHYQHDPEDPKTLSDNNTREVMVGQSGEIWIGTRHGGLNKFDPDTGIFAHYRHDPENPDSLANDRVGTLFQDTQGRIWVGSHGGLNQLDPAQEKFIYYPDLGDGSITSIYEDAQGQLWVGTDEDGLKQFDPDTGEVIHYRHKPEDPKSIGDNNVQVIAPVYGDSNKLWVGTDANGLNQLDITTGLVTRYTRDFQDPNSLSDNDVMNLYTDEAGVLWVGTRRGLDKYAPLSQQFPTYSQEVGAETTLNDDYVQHIYQDELGIFWLGTRAGLSRYDRSNNSYTHFRHTPDDPNSLLSDDVETVVGQSTDTLWISYSGDVWVTKFDVATETFTHYMIDGLDEESQVSSLFLSSGGLVWIGLTGGQLASLNPMTEDVRYYMPDPDNIYNLRTQDISYINEDREGLLWFVEGNTLVKFDPQAEAFTYFPYDDPMYSMYEDNNGIWWIDSENRIMKFDPVSETFFHDEDSAILSDHGFRVVGDDGNGTYWLVAGRDKFYTYNSHTKMLHQYDKRDGFIACCEGYFYNEQRGELSVGGSDIRGFQAFYPQNLQPQEYQPPIVLTQLQYFNENVPVSEDTLLQQPVFTTDALTFKHNDNFAFEFASLDYSNPTFNEYEYMLEGYEEQWNLVDHTRRYAAYTSLPAGNYTFRVRGTNSAGVWSEDEATLAITITPPWWETLWFRGLAVVIFAGLIYGAFRWRVKGIERRNRELEAEVERQTAVIREAESQKQRLAVLEERQRIGRELHDDLGQVLGYVNVQSQAALAQMDQENDTQLQVTLTQMAQVARDAHADVRQYILGIRTGESERLPGPFMPTLKKYLQDLATLYNLNVRLSLPPEWDEVDNTAEIFSIDVETQLLRIIQESLTNVRKHANTNKANLLFTDHGDEVQVIISDEGRGFDLSLADADELQDHFGLTIMQERAEKVGGSLRVRSKPGDGTQIIVRMPKLLQIEPEEAIKGLRVIVADDHQLYLDGLHNLLRTRGVQVVGLAQNGEQVQALAEKMQPDLILMDVDMPICNGLDATKEIKTKWPDIKVVMLTAVEDEEKMFTALRYGASGYLLKSVEGTQFFQMLAAALHGETVLSPDLAAKMLTSFAQNAGTEEPISEPAKDEEEVTLTYRQQEVMELVVQGYTNQEIATKLGLSERTVKHHVSQVLARFQLKSRYELARYAADK